MLKSSLPSSTGLAFTSAGSVYAIVSALCALVSPDDHATIDRVSRGALVGLTWPRPVRWWESTDDLTFTRRSSGDGGGRRRTFMQVTLVHEATTTIRGRWRTRDAAD